MERRKQADQGPWCLRNHMLVNSLGLHFTSYPRFGAEESATRNMTQHTQLKTGPNYMLSTRKYFKYNNFSRLKVKGYKKMYHANINQKKTGVAIY